MDNRLRAAEEAAREARRQAMLARHADLRTTYGECPKYWGHFDWSSFWAGAVCAVLVVLLGAAFIAVRLG